VKHQQPPRGQIPALQPRTRKTPTQKLPTTTHTSAFFFFKIDLRPGESRPAGCIRVQGVIQGLQQKGICRCFKGYSNDNCDNQSMLAM
jgi:hypothetical protein